MSNRVCCPQNQHPQNLDLEETLAETWPRIATILCLNYRASRKTGLRISQKERQHCLQGTAKCLEGTDTNRHWFLSSEVVALNIGGEGVSLSKGGRPLKESWV